MTTEETNNKARPVSVEEHGGSWAVKYLDRKKHGRGMAACFDGRVKTREQVIEWVKSNPKLKLEEAP